MPALPIENDRTDTLKLKPSRVKWVALMLTFIALAGGMAALYIYSEAPKTHESFMIVGFMVAFFVAGALLCALNLLPGRTYLLLTREGFTVRTLFKTRAYSWREVESFGAFSHRGVTLVVFTLSREGRLRFPESGFGKLNKAVSGGDHGLPDTYGIGADELVQLMNRWKAQSSR